MVGMERGGNPRGVLATSSLVRRQTEKVGVFHVPDRLRAEPGGNASTGRTERIFYIMYPLDGKKDRGKGQP